MHLRRRAPEHHQAATNSPPTTPVYSLSLIRLGAFYILSLPMDFESGSSLVACSPCLVGGKGKERNKCRQPDQTDTEVATPNRYGREEVGAHPHPHSLAKDPFPPPFPAPLLITDSPSKYQNTALLGRTGWLMGTFKCLNLPVLPKVV